MLKCNKKKNDKKFCLIDALGKSFFEENRGSTSEKQEIYVKMVFVFFDLK